MQEYLKLNSNKGKCRRCNKVHTFLTKNCVPARFPADWFGKHTWKIKERVEIPPNMRTVPIR